MRTVPLKTADEQAAAVIVKHREFMVSQRTQAINALRGRAAEFSIVTAKGCGNANALLAVLSSDETIPPIAKAMGAVKSGNQIQYICGLQPSDGQNTSLLRIDSFATTSAAASSVLTW
jgi:transposase